MLFKYVYGHGIRIPRCTSHSLIAPLADVNAIRIQPWQCMELNTVRECDSNRIHLLRILIQKYISEVNQMRIAVTAIAFEYDVSECYSHTGDSNRATSFWCSSHSNRGRWIRCTTWRCRFDSLPMRIVCSECNANTAMSFWCECKLNSAMNIAIHIAVAEWDVHVNWIRWIATYRDSTVFTVFTIFSFDANLIHCLVTWEARCRL